VARPSVATYVPRFAYCHEMVRHLMEIEGACRLVEVLALPPDAAFRLKYDAQRRSTRFSTGIEGNPVRLETLAAAAARVRDRALALQETRPRARAPWETLPRRQQQLLSRVLIARSAGGELPNFTAGDVASWYLVSVQTARAWLTEWRAIGLVTPVGQQQRVRAWTLTDEFAALVEGAG